MNTDRLFNKVNAVTFSKKFKDVTIYNHQSPRSLISLNIVFANMILIYVKRQTKIYVLKKNIPEKEILSLRYREQSYFLKYSK